MEPLLQQVVNILTVPPGNLIFHLVLAFSILASLQAIWITRQGREYPHSGRMLFGLGMLLAGQFVLFLSSGLAWQGVIDAHILLPPLDRAVTVFSLVWIVWLWGFPKPARLGDLVTGFLNLGVVLLFIFTYASWTVQGSGQAFNNNWIDWVWELAGLVIVLTGMAILLFSRPAGWGFGLGILTLSLAGFAAHLAWAGNSKDFSGFIRLSQLAAYPLLPTLLQQITTSRVVEVTAKPKRNEAKAAQSASPFSERRRYSSDSRTVHAFLELKEKEDPQKAGSVLAKAIAHTMLADLCFIVTVPKFNQVSLLTGYDLVREEELEGTFIDQSKVPQLGAALLRGKALRFSSNDPQPDDLQAIANVLGLKEPGTLLLVPLGIGDKPWGGILLLSPYANRQWNQDDQNFLASETERIVRILTRAEQRIVNEKEQKQVEETIQKLQASIEPLKQDNQKLTQSLEAARRELENIHQNSTQVAHSPELAALVALQRESQETINNLQAENEQLQQLIHEDQSSSLTSVEAVRLEADLRSTLQDLANLQNKLAEANTKILTLERQDTTTGKVGEDHEVLTSLVQDLRQPMVSIMGYTDLLLAESVGILGASQRKFLERIRASAERMRSMLDDLIHITTQDTNLQDLIHRPVELGSIIDGAMLDTSAQLREKDITLRVDLPEELPLVHSGREAIQQIVIHLLQNAGSVSPQEGSVTLRLRVQEESGEKFLLIQVIDSGGGIQPELLSQVFSPRYRAENALIQGLGDTGIGLTITKDLVKSHGGRIWVNSEIGQNTTFSVLFPLNSNSLEKALG